ncbi:hypothetical protein [Ralstonia sp. Ralssp110]|jgi:hypothetical protein|uniref:hypothetical protein n=1 Tax=Ralstonia sp. Ralssp110 TaxID=3243004 RepID=UPI0039B4FBCE
MSLEDNLLYAQGALSGRDYLRRAQMDMKVQRQFSPQTLRLEYQHQVKDKAVEYQAGFLDAIGAFMLTSLDGVTVDLYRWEVLHVLARANKQK